MKLKTIIFITALLILTALLVNISSQEKKEEFKPLEIEVGDEFHGIDYGEVMYVLNYAVGEVTGDGKNDMILMVGSKEGVDNAYATKVDVVVYDTENSSFQKAGLKNYEGKSPKLQLADVTADGINDIMLVLENNDQTKNIRIVKSGSEYLKEIFNKRDNRGIVFVGEIMDGVKAHLRCGKFSKEMYIELMDFKNQWVQEGKVNESGKVIISNPQVTTTSFCTVELIHLGSQDGLQTIQHIIAFPEGNIIDEVIATWKYEDGKWKVVQAKGNRVGDLVY